jgi:uncharacterized protein (DUF302 family)
LTTPKPKLSKALKTEGFGVLTEIDMQSKLKEKLGVDFKKYQILVHAILHLLIKR